jgi:2-haloacid dehalogenase
VRLGDFEALSFDCYGTLVDWEAGLIRALAPWRARTGIAADDEALLAAFARHETAQQAETPGLVYPDLLARVLARIAADWRTDVGAEEARAFGASIGAWPPFPDSPAALAYLDRHYALVVLSNVDRASFAATEAALGVRFDAVYTAQDIGSYKPDARNFAYLVERLAERGIAKSKVLHVAQSLYHDHVPAKAAGLATAWIDRRAGRPGGATAPVAESVAYDFRFETLGALAGAHRAETGAGDTIP